MASLLELLGNWYVDGIEATGLDPAVTAADRLYELLYRLAMEPDLPKGWRYRLTELAGPHTVTLVARMREERSPERLFRLHQETGRGAIHGELHRLLVAVNQHAFRRCRHSVSTKDIAKAAIALEVAEWLADHTLGDSLGNLIWEEWLKPSWEQAKARWTTPSSTHDQARPAPEHRLQQEPEAHGLADLDLAVRFEFLAPPKRSTYDQWRGTIYCFGNDLRTIDEIMYTSGVWNVSRSYHSSPSNKEIRFSPLGSSTNKSLGFRMDVTLEHVSGVMFVNYLFMKIFVKGKYEIMGVVFSYRQDDAMPTWHIGKYRWSTDDAPLTIDRAKIPFERS